MQKGAEAKHGRKDWTIRKEIVIRTSQQRAFRAFTEQLDKWWPRSHHIGKVEMKEAVLEPREGGRWYEIGVDGTECLWGKVLVWNPPSQIVLAWQITGQWQYDPNFFTEVNVQFTALGLAETRLTLEHRNIEKFGTQAEEIWSTFDSDSGWTGILKLLAKVAES